MSLTEITASNSESGDSNNDGGSPAADIQKNKRSAAEEDSDSSESPAKKKKENREPKGAVAEFDAALAKHLSGEDNNESAVQYSNEYVSDKFLEAFPEYASENNNKWIPVNKLVDGKLSPQSGIALEILRQKYGTEDRAWNAGWRWHMIEHNHMWYPPKFDKEGGGELYDNKIDDYNARVKLHSRGKPSTKLKGSVSSVKIEEIVNKIDEIEEMF